LIQTLISLLPSGCLYQSVSMGDAEKRARSAGEGGEGVEEAPRERKRARRWDDAPAAPVVAGGDAPKVAAVLAKQKELALKLQQLKQLKQAQAPTPTTEATPAPTGASSTRAAAHAQRHHSGRTSP